MNNLERTIEAIDTLEESVSWEIAINNSDAFYLLEPSDLKSLANRVKEIEAENAHLTSELSDKQKQIDDLEAEQHLIILESNETVEIWKQSYKKLESELSDLKGEKEKWRLALESLTPQGSEFFNDAEACVRYVCAKHSRLDASFKREIKDRKALESELSDYRALVDAADEINFPVNGDDCTQLIRRDGKWFEWRLPSAGKFDSVIDAFKSLQAENKS